MSQVPGRKNATPRAPAGNSKKPARGSKGKTKASESEAEDGDFNSREEQSGERRPSAAKRQKTSQEVKGKAKAKLAKTEAHGLMGDHPIARRKESITRRFGRIPKARLELLELKQKMIIPTPPKRARLLKEIQKQGQDQHQHH